MNYLKNIFEGIWRLMQGMYISFLNFVRPKVTEEYPENRGKTFPHQRMRGELIMPHNANNRHKCTACGICEINCPNGTIQVISKKQLDEETGREKKVLDVYLYDLGSCTYCSLCTISCPQKAIEWSNNFEHAVYRRSKMLNRLNTEGSCLEVKPKVIKENKEI